MTNCVIIIGIFLSVMSIVMGAAATKSKDKLFYTAINKICSANIFSMIVNLTLIPKIFRIDFSMHILPKILIPNIIALFIYSITKSGCDKKLKDENTPEAPKKSHAAKFAAIIIVIPLIMFFSFFIREYYYIHNSDILMVFNYYYNDHAIFGKEDTGWYACAMNDSYCKKVDFGGVSLIEKLMPQDMEVIVMKDLWLEKSSESSVIQYNKKTKEYEYTVKEYTIYISDNYNTYTVYKNDKMLCSFSDTDPWIGDKVDHRGDCVLIYLRQ